MAWASKLPAAIDGLAAIFAAWPGLSGVDVLDGPPLSQQTFREVLAVGWTGGEDETDAESTLLTEGLGGSPDREQFTIRCAAVVMRGSSGLPDVRRRAYELLAEAGAAIAANRTLNGAVMRAMVGSHSLAQDLATKGAQVTVTFEVSCDAYSGA
jgi:hypothetical protein